MSRPILLDICCGAGGAAEGYRRAGFDIVGIDHLPQRHFPFDFVLSDALSYLERMLTGVLPFDAIHASPPCQAYAQAALGQRNAGRIYPDLIGPIRELLQASGLPWVIENVPGAPMRPDFRLCGCLFGLNLRRVRWFETSWHGYELISPCSHMYYVPSVVGHGTPTWVRKQLGYNPTIAHYRAAMGGVNWMNRDELSLAIPPQYTEYIGAQLIAQLTK